MASVKILAVTASFKRKEILLLQLPIICSAASSEPLLLAKSEKVCVAIVTAKLAPRDLFKSYTSGSPAISPASSIKTLTLCFAAW